MRPVTGRMHTCCALDHVLVTTSGLVLLAFEHSEDGAPEARRAWLERDWARTKALNRALGLKRGHRRPAGYIRGAIAGETAIDLLPAETASGAA